MAGRLHFCLWYFSHVKDGNPSVSYAEYIESPEDRVRRAVTVVIALAKIKVWLFGVNFNPSSDKLTRAKARAGPDPSN